MSKTTKEEALAEVKAAFGFVPNLMAGITDTNPAVATAYLGASAALEGGVLSPVEKQIVMLAVASFNDCHYCTAAHRAAGKAMGVSLAELEAIDDRQLSTDPRTRALVETAWTILSERGWVSDATLARLGVSRAEAFEIIALIALKTIESAPSGSSSRSTRRRMGATIIARYDRGRSAARLPHAADGRSRAMPFRRTTDDSRHCICEALKALRSSCDARTRCWRGLVVLDLSTRPRRCGHCSFALACGCRG